MNLRFVICPGAAQRNTVVIAPSDQTETGPDGAHHEGLEAHHGHEEDFSRITFANVVSFEIFVLVS